ncbi:MAG: cytochrome c oxidase accessory protein CcoG [Bdellovibrionota bacterium]
MENEKLDSQLTTQTESGQRLTVIPAVVKGHWHKRRFYFQWVLLFIFLAIPWIEINEKPLLLFNVADRRFILFGIDLWATDAPLVFFVFAILAFGLFFATALWGRVWCGWACPQTVFIERVFRQIEILIEGNHLKRRKLQKQNWNFEKISKRFLKYSIFVVLAWIFSNSFLAYFVGKEHLFEMMGHSPYDNPESFAVMMVFFGGVLFDFVWFREQFCTIVCPYGRFQSVLMDTNSMLVAYDEKRGEPRGKLKRNEDNSAKGDCIDCNKCVTVCPTGIDIRNGTQMECIACTACIDACDDVMEKLKKPKGLIRYTSERELQGRKVQRFNVRSIVYSILLLLLSSALIYSLAGKKDVEFQLLRQQALPYQVVEKDSSKLIQNVVQIKVMNHSSNEHAVSFKLKNNETGIRMINPIPVYNLSPEKNINVSLILQIEDFKNVGKTVNIEVFEKEKFLQSISYQLKGPSAGVNE